MSDFATSLDYVIQNEGRGYQGPPYIDQPTNTGIIAEDIAEYRNIPLAEVTAQDVQDLSQGEILAIYKTLYWDKMRLDEVVDPNIATCIFDTGVNRGIYIGSFYAQKVCNQIGTGALVLDGIIGYITLAAINKCDRRSFINAYESLGIAGYVAILDAHPGDEVYRRGWFARSQRLLTLV